MNIFAKDKPVRYNFDLCSGINYRTYSHTIHLNWYPLFAFPVDYSSRHNWWHIASTVEVSITCLLYTPVPACKSRPADDSGHILGHSLLKCLTCCLHLVQRTDHRRRLPFPEGESTPGYVVVPNSLNYYQVPVTDCSMNWWLSWYDFIRGLLQQWKGYLLSTTYPLSSPDNPFQSEWLPTPTVTPMDFCFRARCAIFMTQSLAQLF